MSLFETFLVGRFVVFTLVLARVSGMMVTAPIFGSQAIPVRVRALLAVALSLLITPIHVGASLPPIDAVASYALLIANEVLVGLLIGVGMNILFAGIQVAGQIISQLSGMSLADVFNPGFDANVSIFSQLFFFLAVAVFVAIGGHRMMAEALLDTFAWAPPGQAALGDTYVEVLNSIVSQSFALGIRAAAPLMVSLLLSTLVLGLIGRTLPQINIIAVGFGLNSLLTMSGLFLALGAIIWTFQEPTIDILHQLKESLGMP